VLETLLTPPELSFGPLESFVIYALLILTFSSIITEKVIDLLHVKSMIAKLSSFLLLASVLSHLIYVQNSSFLESILIIGVLVVSFVMMVLHKVIVPARQVSA